jgi:hypothetical protein
MVKSQGLPARFRIHEGMIEVDSLPRDEQQVHYGAFLTCTVLDMLIPFRDWTTMHYHREYPLVLLVRISPADPDDVPIISVRGKEYASS